MISAMLLIRAGMLSLLSRSNDLIGIEIATQQPLDELITAFAHTITQKGLAAELLVIGEPLPLLYQKGLLVMDGTVLN